MMNGVVTQDEWAADRMYGSEPSPRLLTEADPGEEDGAHIDLDDAPADPENTFDRDEDSAALKAALWLGAVLIIAVGAITLVLLGSGGDDTAVDRSAVAVPAPVAPVAPVAAPSTPSMPDQDRAIPFTASANCPAGSTSAQSLADPAKGSAWTCVRGQPGARVDGQVLHVDLGGSHVLSAVTVIPGWVARTPGVEDEWLRHRVVTRLQYVFDDTDRTVFTQDTGNAHGPVTTALPHRVLAAHVTVIVLQTSRPAASPLPTIDTGAPVLPGFGDSVLGPSGAPPRPDGTVVEVQPPPEDPGDDPVDATVSISALTFLGHQPM